jgi:hypothetical protein
MSNTLKRQRKKNENIWLVQPKDATFFTKLRKVINFFKNICKHKIVDFWGKKNKVEARFKKAQETDKNHYIMRNYNKCDEPEEENPRHKGGKCNKVNNLC